MHTNTNDERLSSLALYFCQGIGYIGAKRLVDGMGSAASVFEHRKELPQLIEGVNSRVVELLDNPAAWQRAEAELEFAEKNGLQCLTLKDEAYPSRLRECEDAPIALFFKGTCDFNRLHVVSMVGTRNATEYGKEFCESFIADLARLLPDTLVMSGLAYGIDIHAHRAALQHGLSTVGVLAHGLDRIYPYVHRHTATEMLRDGGLLTEFPSSTNPDRQNFVCRNRIVAGMADATIVVESAERGGSLITADLANGYNRDCFAVPGRLDNILSKGCNKLIHDHKARLLLSAEDFAESMGWMPSQSSQRPQAVQRSLFVDLDSDEQCIVNLLEKMGDTHINTLMVESNIAINRLTSLLFELEMKGVVRALVGGTYKLIGL